MHHGRWKGGGQVSGAASQKIPAARPAAIAAPVPPQRSQFGDRRSPSVPVSSPASARACEMISGFAIARSLQPVAIRAIWRAAFLAVAAGTDHPPRIGPAVDAIQHGIIAAIEEILHLAGQRREVLRRGEDIAISSQHIRAVHLRSRSTTAQQRPVRRGHPRAAGLRHLAGAPGQRVIYDQQSLHQPTGQSHPVLRFHTPRSTGQTK